MNGSLTSEFSTGSAGRGVLQAAGGVSAVVLANGRRIQLDVGQASMVEAALTVDQFLSPEEASHWLGVSRPMVLRWIKDGSLLDQPVGTHHRGRARLGSGSAREAREAAGQAAMDVLAAAEKGDAAAAARVEGARERAQAQIAARDSAGRGQL